MKGNLIIVAMFACYFLLAHKIEQDKIEIKTIVEDYHNCELEKQIKELKEKKNTLMLIALERGKKRPNKHYLDSLEVDYELR